MKRKYDFNEALNYFYEHEYEISIKERRFIKFAHREWVHWYDTELYWIYFDPDADGVDLLEAIYISVICKEITEDVEGMPEIDKFIEKCNEICPGYVKEA